ncbi:MAG TPA: cob(I)yrinic acid a,c-diamide adenosyltransferase [Methanomassiliicoccales archaeon]|nr:cob(I)yrinic acid a,c-diamide adenosyltransferase [Methanomassiliicoccales archaeon]
MKDLGLVQVYTGTGKGKTTAALGLALRAWGRGLRICMIQFMKRGEDYGEIRAIRSLKGIDLFQYGRGALLFEKGVTDEDRRLGSEALAKAHEALTSGKYDLVILDEVNVAAYYGVVTAADVIRVVRARGKEVEVVLTGRNAPMEFIDEADLVTDMVMRKHPYEKGLEAREGIEY